MTHSMRLHRLAVILILTAGTAISQTVWTPVSGGTANELNHVRFFNETEGWIGGDGETILMSADSGNSWNSIAGGFPGQLWLIRFVSRATGYCSTTFESENLFCATHDSCRTWACTPVDLIVGQYHYLGSSWFFLDAQYGWMIDYSSGFISGVIVTRDSAETWEHFSLNYSTSSGTVDGSSVKDILFIDPEHGWACGNLKKTLGGHTPWYDGALWRTTDGGETWEFHEKLDVDPYRLTAVDSMHAWVLVGTFADPLDYAIMKTTDGGVTWEELTGTPTLNSFWFADPDSGRGVSDHNIYKTLDGGATWETTYTDESAQFLDIDFMGETGCIVGADGLILKYLSPNLTSVREEKAGPSTFSLRQNYPNPFNAETVIEFELGSSAETQISIYDVNGRLMESIKSGRLEAGTHRITWNADGHPSGIYLIMVKAGELQKSMKCLLLK